MTTPIDPALRERFDLLLSAALDGELDATERAELDALRAAHPALTDLEAARRTRFESVSASLRQVAQDAAAAAGNDATSGLAALEARIRAEDAPQGSRTTASHAAPGSSSAASSARPRVAAWLVPLAAAAAVALYAWGGFGPAEDAAVAPRAPTPSTAAVEGVERSDRSAKGAPSPSEDAALASGAVAAEDDLLDIALLAEIEAAELGDELEPGDLEIIEQLDLMDFLAAAEGEERG